MIRSQERMFQAEEVKACIIRFGVKVQVEQSVHPYARYQSIADRALAIRCSSEFIRRVPVWD